MKSKLKITFKIIDDLFPKISKVINNISMVFLLLILGFITIDVSLRSFFNISVLGPYVYESVELMMVILIFSGLSYCELKKSNICVDLLVSKFSQSIRTAIDIVTYLLCIIFVILLTWRSIVKTLHVRESGTIALALDIPIYPFMAIVTIGSAFLGLTLVYNLIHIILDARIKK